MSRSKKTTTNTKSFTRKQFITAYQGQLQLVYEWARSTRQLHTFMRDVETSISIADIKYIPLSESWASSEVVQATWEQLGGTGKVTLNKLRELPVGKDETV